VQPLIRLYLSIILGMVGRVELVGKSNRTKSIQETWESIRGEASFSILRLASALLVVVMVPLMTISRLCGILIPALVTLRP
jgi:hypothetical protein